MLIKTKYFFKLNKDIGWFQLDKCSSSMTSCVFIKNWYESHTIDII